MTSVSSTTLATVFVLFFPVLGLCIVLVEEWVVPWRTPQAVIEAMADEAERNAPHDPVEYAVYAMDHAGRRSELIDHGRWRRVLRTLERRARARRAAGRG